MKIPIAKGIYTTSGYDFRESYPVNMTVVVQNTGVDEAYLRTAEGIEFHFQLPFYPDRGGINWRGDHYRVVGANLIKYGPGASYTLIGGLLGGTSSQVTMDYSFDRLAIAIEGKLYYYDGTTLNYVTDPDLGYVVDMVWVDGYFMTTDGQYLIVTDLNNPYAVNPLKYGSSEADSDPIKALLKVKNEVYALNRHTTEIFDNVGGQLFPFARIEGAQIQKGVIGTHACAVINDAIVFVGGGRNESPSIYIGSNGNAIKIATREIDLKLSSYTESQLSQIIVESRTTLDQILLYVHLPDQTLLYDLSASKVFGSPVWSILSSGNNELKTYRARNFVWVHDKWWAGDPTSQNIGTMNLNEPKHFTDDVGWEFRTSIIFNGTKKALVHKVELVGLYGRSSIKRTIFTSHSRDGVTWSLERLATTGDYGLRESRVVWFQNGIIDMARVQKFRGIGIASFAMLDMQLEDLAV